ncbi:MAG: pseudouridine-5'-phosphate glycosidase [Lachnospiraceae bacterium]|nr:pseudouridine-5'-phosphate glycosidase [Lachnospiraceae bacterium]
MGTIASDFYSRFGSIDIVEAPFTVEELMNMASVEVQGRYAAWTAENGDAGYIPAEILLALLEDRAFFAHICEIVDSGEFVVLSGATLACTTAHINKMGLTPEDVQSNILDFFMKSEEMSYSIESILSGTSEWVTSLYVFANGWVGIETEHMENRSWDEDGNPTDADGVPSPASSYLISNEGELVASPDIRYDIEAWMEFVDMFSAVHEEATAADNPNEDRKVEMEMTKEGYIVFSEEVEKALKGGEPVVVIESAATFGGMIYPGIADFARRMRSTVKKAGAMPAFTAILGGKIHVGLTDEEILYLEERRGSIFKASARDIPILLAKKQDGVMTIAAAVQTAALVGVHVAVGSGIGGAQIGAEKTMDISTDLESLAKNMVMVVCSGTKPILDLSLTMEYLETAGVPVVGYQTDRMPEYMVRGSGFRLTYRMEKPEELAEVMHIKKLMNIPGGVLVVNPVPKEYELDPVRTRKAVDAAMEDVRKNHVMGKAITGYMMGRIKDYLGPESVEAQKAFLLNNAELAAKLAGAIADQNRKMREAGK